MFLQKNPYWNELEHCHNFTGHHLFKLLKEVGLIPIHYDISRRYRMCMEVIAIIPEKD